MIHLILLFSCLLSFASAEIALQMVPRGKVFEEQGRDYILKTPSGTKIRIEFKRDGTFEEAKGMNLNYGDEFEPGEGLISLGTAAKEITKKIGTKPQGHWRLSKDTKLDWVYELGEELVNAKNGEFISSK